MKIFLAHREATDAYIKYMDEIHESVSSVLAKKPINHQNMELLVIFDNKENTSYMRIHLLNYFSFVKITVILKRITNQHNEIQ